MTNLSPTAQAVMDAWIENTNYAPIDNEPFALAAALCAVADQVVPRPARFPEGEYKLGIRDAKQDVRAAILAIATELRTKS
jgi:hypothetical protein